MNGFPKIVKLLCKSGAKIDDKDRFGRTALYMASAKGSEECVEMLIEETFGRCKLYTDPPRAPSSYSPAPYFAQQLRTHRWHATERRQQHREQSWLFQAERYYQIRNVVLQ